jgi:hypothetical protein
MIAKLYTVFFKTFSETVFVVKVKEKGKAIPLQVWTGHKGSRSLRFPDFMTIGT